MGRCGGAGGRGCGWVLAYCIVLCLQQPDRGEKWKGESTNGNDGQQAASSPNDGMIRETCRDYHILITGTTKMRGICSLADSVFPLLVRHSNLASRT